LVAKFLLVENYSAELKSVIDVDAIRRRLLVKLFSKINIESDIEQISNVISTCIELCENKSILELVINDENIIDTLMKILVMDCTGFDSQQDYNYTETLIVLINILKLISIENLKTPCYLPGAEDLVNSENNNTVFDNTLLGSIVLHNLPTIIANFPIIQNDSNLIDGTFGMFFHPLGVRR
jgi:hypothetical protein